MPYIDTRPYTDSLLKITQEGVGGRKEGTTFEHPCFGRISLSRISGHFDNGTLFQTNVESHSAIRLTIKRAKVARDLSTDWVHDADELIEVYLSPTQFADMLTNMNTSGVPCTIKMLKTGPEERTSYSMPQMECHAAKTRAEFHRLCETMELGPTEEETAQMEAMITKLPKKNQEAMRGLFRNQAWRIKDHAGFMRDRFEKDVVHMVTEAKREVQAFTETLVIQTGIAALKGQEPPRLLLSMPQEAPTLDATIISEENPHA